MTMLLTSMLAVLFISPVSAHRSLHIDSSHDLPPITIPASEWPPWMFPTFATEKEPETSGQVISSVEEATTTGTAGAALVGLQPCPNDPGVQGFVAWNEMVQYINKANSNERKHPYLLCPGVRFDALGTELQIKHYFTSISCAGLNCVVSGADIKVSKNLKGIRFEGVEFAALSSPVLIGDDTHALFSRCTIRDSIFQDAGKAPIVSYGHTFVESCGFFNNVGHGGAILAAEHTMHVDKSIFVNNTAQNWADSGAAIQVGEKESSMAALMATGSCFDGNTGANVVLLTEKSYLSLSKENTVLSTSTKPVFCEGSYQIMTGAAGTCEPFEGKGISCQALLGSLAPLSSSEAGGNEPYDPSRPFGTDVIDQSDMDDPSRPFGTDMKDGERNDDDPIANELGTPNGQGSPASFSPPSSLLWAAVALVATVCVVDL